jgi:sigma-B regulation protein RsbU (phosphoserine phosphatase)
VLLDWIGDHYQCAVLRGVTRAATAAGANLLCFVGGELPLDRLTSDVKHRVYDLVGPSAVDGVLLLGSTMSNAVGVQGLERFCERFRSLPVCSLGERVGDLPCVSVGNEAGMREVVLHLITQHGARRIAFVRGPLANGEAELRLSAYRSALAEHGIELDPRLVVTGDFSQQSGEAAVRELADGRGVALAELNAIVASNDNMALGVLAALERRNLRVPSQLAVVGFDDIEEAALVEPALTTVRQPFDRQGYDALHLLLAALRDGTAPRSVQLDTEATIRGSCGCETGASTPRRHVPSTRNLGFDAALLQRRQQILDVLTRVTAGSFGAAGSDWQGRLLSALVADLSGEAPRAFQAAFLELVTKLHGKGVDPQLFNALISALRLELVPLLRSDVARLDRAEELFHLGRLTVSNTVQRLMVRQRLNLGHSIRAMTSVCNGLSASFEPAELDEHVLTRLPSLGFQCCMVVLYDGSGERGARLRVGYDRRTGQSWTGGGVPFDPKHLLPPEIVHSEGPGRSFVVMPLSYKRELLGHVMLELNLEHAFAYGPLTEALTTAVRGARAMAHGLPESGPRSLVVEAASGVHPRSELATAGRQALRIGPGERP